MTKYNKETGCPFCSCKNIIRLESKDLLSQLYCTKCGATFVSLNDNNIDKQGLFTGICLPVKKENLYLGKE